MSDLMADFPEPLSSYQFPVTAPSDNPLLGAFVSVQYPAFWQPYVLACLMQLLQVTTWDTDNETVLEEAINYANDLILLFQGVGMLVPPGCVMGWGTDTAPSGWLACDGSEVSRLLYADLFAAIGTNYGAGDGTSTFNVPDMRGRVLVGAGSGSGLTPRYIGNEGGEEDHVLLGSEMPVHSHTDAGHTHSVHSHLSGLAVSPGELPVSLPNVLPELTGSGTANLDSSGGDGGHNTMQPFTVALWIIKV